MQGAVSYCSLFFVFTFYKFYSVLRNFFRANRNSLFSLAAAYTFKPCSR